MIVRSKEFGLTPNPVYQTSQPNTRIRGKTRRAAKPKKKNAHGNLLSSKLENDPNIARLRRDLVSHVAFDGLSRLARRDADVVFHQQRGGHELDLGQR